MMDDDLLCPNCSHPLGAHGYYYGTCQTPKGIIYVQEFCGCPLTLHNYIQTLLEKNSDKELKKEQERNQMYLAEMAKYQTIVGRNDHRIKVLDEMVNNVKQILIRAKAVEETRPIYSRFVNDYRTEINEIIDEAILELEKNNDRTYER